MKIQISTITHSAVVWWYLTATFFGHRFSCRRICIIVTVWKSNDCVNSYHAKKLTTQNISISVIFRRMFWGRNLQPANELSPAQPSENPAMTTVSHWSTAWATAVRIWQAQFIKLNSPRQVDKTYYPKRQHPHINHKNLPISLCGRILLFFRRGI